MKEELISFETAKLANKKGLPSFGISMGEYNPEGFLQHGYVYNGISAPTQSLLQKWLREVHDIHVFNVGSPKYSPCVMFNKYNYHRQDDELEYEKALELGLQKALTLIKL